MRLIKGSKVEVLVNTSRLEVEWHGARITSGNGHTYNVKYDHSSSNDKALSRRVPRKAIRPCPPAMKNIEGLKVNDAVEVWNDGCWKKATVLKHMTGELYLVALHGSCMELKVQEIHIRMCQSWENGQWIISPKVNFCCLSSFSISVIKFKIASILNFFGSFLVVKFILFV